jgi:hypothetical protein
MIVLSKLRTRGWHAQGSQGRMEARFKLAVIEYTVGVDVTKVYWGFNVSRST